VHTRHNERSPFNLLSHLVSIRRNAEMTRRHRHEQPRRRKTGTDRHLYYIASSWYEICGKLSEEHLQGGPHVKEIRNWRSATRYVEKYVAKPENFPEGIETGRIWGTWNGGMLTVRRETVKVSVKEAYRIRRIYRRLAGMKGRGQLYRLTVFVRHENVLRLLEFLGYRQEE